MRSVPVYAAKPYEVKIGEGLIGCCGEEIRKISNAVRAAIVTDHTVSALYEESVRQSLESAGISVCSFSFPAGEESKTLETYGKLIRFLSEENLSRSDLIVALGGGIPGDLAGFAAATYLRGIPFVQIPTTFLAAIDASVGGKTAVNLPKGKNLVGAFCQPSLVLCDPSSLRTLPEEIYSDGAAEAIKYGVIEGRDLFEKIAAGNWREQPQEIIERCVAIKARIVREDEFDTGARQILNFGHTFGHAIEKLSHYEISHGKAVGIGMLMAARAAERFGISRENCALPIAEALKQNGLPLSCGFSAAGLAEAAYSDKKRSGVTVRMIFPEVIGRCVIRPVPVGELEAFFRAGMEE